MIAAAVVEGVVVVGWLALGTIGVAAARVVVDELRGAPRD